MTTRPAPDQPRNAETIGTTRSGPVASVCGVALEVFHIDVSSVNALRQFGIATGAEL